MVLRTPGPNSAYRVSCGRGRGNRTMHKPPGSLVCCLTSRRPVSLTEDADTDSLTFMNWLTRPSSPTFIHMRSDSQTTAKAASAVLFSVASWGTPYPVIIALKGYSTVGLPVPLFSSTQRSMGFPRKQL